MIFARSRRRSERASILPPWPRMRRARGRSSPGSPGSWRSTSRWRTGASTRSCLSQPDAALREVARRFQQEMGGLHAAFSAFTARWPTAAAISRDAAGFVGEARPLLAALEERIHREDRELFQLAQRSP